jgi:hypothetical protein
MTGYLWCPVCKAWRMVAQRGVRAYRCWRCDFDLRAGLVTRVDLYRHWREH